MWTKDFEAAVIELQEAGGCMTVSTGGEADSWGVLSVEEFRSMSDVDPRQETERALRRGKLLSEQEIQSIMAEWRESPDAKV